MIDMNIKRYLYNRSEVVRFALRVGCKTHFVEFSIFKPRGRSDGDANMPITGRPAEPWTPGRLNSPA